MKAFFIGVLLALIASAASAQNTRLEIAPIVKSSNGGLPILVAEDLSVEPEIQPIQPETPAIDTNSDPNLVRGEFSSTRKQVEQAALRTNGPRFICRGIEPFWVLKIEQQNVEFDLVGEGFTKFSAPSATPSLNSALAVTNIMAKDDNGKEISALVVDASRSSGVACTDGLSDQTYSHSVFINQSGKIFDGCCWMER